MTAKADRLAACRARLDGLADQPLEERAAALEFLLESLRAELDDLLAREDSADGRS